MAILRISADQKNKRIIGFRAWHRGLRQMVHVRSCNFDIADEQAEIITPFSQTTSIAQMKELVLLQDTNSYAADGRHVYEGDIIVVELENQFGSFERCIGEVAFDEVIWGYNVKLFSGSGLPLTGRINVLDIIGNVFQGIDESKQKEYGEQKRIQGGKK